MKQQHHPTDIKSFEKGVNSDANKELLGPRQGEHPDAKNMRSIPMDGDNFAKKKIKGEHILYPNIDNRCLNGTGLPLSTDYECMLSLNINGHIVEAWATFPNLNPQPSLMRIDGKIVLMSSDFPIRADYPLEYDKNETCIGGEFYITDNLSKPMVFNVKDLLVNSGVTIGNSIGICTGKYFGLFDLSLYQVGVSSSLYKMSFIKSASSTSGNYGVVFGSLGMVVGMFSYSYRYVTDEGDRSGWSPVTEQVPVVRGKSNMSIEFAKAGNFGSAPSISNPTSNGNHLRLKYDNNSQFTFIEVRRDGWYAGATLNTPPISDILGSFPINNGLNVIDILDYAAPSETEEPLTEEDLADLPESINTAKAIRYFNSKLWLMNVKYQEKDIEDTVEFVEDNGDRVIPVVQKMYKKGHIEPFNSTYYKSNMRGEVNGFGVALYDDTGARTFAVPIVGSFEFPNRRDPVSPESLGLSYFGVVKAADTNGNAPSDTYEVFDHATAVDRYVDPNESAPDRGPFPLYPLGPAFGIGQYPDLVNILKEQTSNLATRPYKTLNPVSQTDPVSDYNRRINTHVYTNNGYNPDPIDYNPKCFSLDYYSMGVAFKGIKTDNLPPWVDGFSVVQTDPAQKVVAQGLGFYSLIDTEGGTSSGGGKQTKQILCNFPDLDPDIGLNSTAIIDLIGSGNVGASSQYRLQVVSPLGFFSEFYSYYSAGGNALREAVDGIAYCRILKDSGLINPGWEGSVSLNSYVGFGTWRRETENNSMFLNNTNNNLFTISSIVGDPTANASTVNLLITTVEDIYTQSFTGSVDSQDFFEPGLKKWHEPIYVVNIVRVDAQINSGILTQYNHTGHYIKLKSKVLEANGSASQSTVLVSERWEDCIPRINGQIYNTYSNYERFTYVTAPNGFEQRWVNVTFKTATQVNAIQSDISLNGFATLTDPSGSYDVYGIYTSNQTTDGTSPIFTLTYNGLASGTKVHVRYDNRIPIRVFGGDTYINDHIFPVLDFTYGADGDPQDSSHEFKFNVPFPYPMYALNALIGLVGDTKPTILGSRYLTHTKLDNGTVAIGGNVFAGLIYFDTGIMGVDFGGAYRPTRWRQLVAMWTAETRTNLSFAYNIEVTKTEEDAQFFPLKNYIYRPGRWDKGDDPDSFPPGDSFFNSNHIYDQYYFDYGREHDNWGRGGFRFREAVNIDYSKRQTTEFITTVPSVGFEEEIEFCTRILWSVTRPINIQDTPTVKTFLPNNFYDIADDTGEIKFAWDADSDKGNNLYAITASGVCLLLVDKRILSEINSNELATIGSNIGGINDVLWLDKEIGMDGQNWRSWAEYSNTLFWVNSTSSYELKNNTIKDLSDTGYGHLLRTKWIPKANKGVISKLSGVYDILHKEYWATANNRGQSGDTHSTLIFGTTQDALQCQSDYKYDKYLAVNNKVYGMKNFETYELGVGNLINGEEYECYVTGASDADMYLDKEFIRIRVNSNSKPKRIEFFDNYEEYEADNPSSIVDAIANPINIKDYFGYECYIPRKAFAPFNRQQGRLVIFKVISDDDENFFVSTAGIQYKALK